MAFPEAYRLVNPQGQPAIHVHNNNESFSRQGDHITEPPRYGVSADAIKPPELIHASMSTVNIDLQNPRIHMTRTPSPTPSETRELERIGQSSGLINWKLLRSKDFWLSRNGLKYGLIGAVIITIVVLFAVYHKAIIIALTPATNWCKDHTLGWLIPVAILLILSFPPLFGHEIIGMLCGVTWGIGEGFGIVALGTLLGEVANYFVFKYWCTARSQKYEKKKIWYACLARVVRTGGFKVALAARLSLIPPHLTTTVFASSGMSFVIFLAAAVCSLPKQFMTVIIGVLLEESVNGTSSKDKIVSAIVAIIFGAITSFALRYVDKKMDEVKPAVIYERRKARQAKMFSESNT
jgi:uncharacterized membrane protein YdjX (TVP38/TMEM64 family)